MKALQSILLVAGGGGLGSALRYVVSKWLIRCIPFNEIWATAIVNLSACFILGLLLGLTQRSVGISSELRLFLTAGFCGGYSTFSTFSAEVLQQFQSGFSLQALLYLSISIIGGMLSVWLGYMASQ